MALSSEKRGARRVTFQRGIKALIMAIDGTWRRECVVLDISETGAKLSVQGSIQGINLREFFLLLSSTGLAYRRCQLVRVNGDEIGIYFLTHIKSAKKSGASNAGFQLTDA